MHTLWPRCRGSRASLWCAIVMASAGCVAPERTHEALRVSRARAYRDWARTRQAQEAAEATISGSLSLEDALKLALAHSKPLQVVLQEKVRARGRVLESYAAALPKVDATGAYRRLDEVASFGVGAESISIGDVNNYSVDLTVRQPVYRGGAISAALRVARLYACLSDERIRGLVQDVVYQVSHSYSDVLLAQELFRVNEDAVKSAAAHLEDVKKKRRHGVASDFDVLRAEVEVSNFRAEMIQQRNRIHLGKAALLKAMGVAQESEVTLSDTLSYAPMKPVLDAAVRIAFENRPDLYQAELSVRMQGEALAIAKSRYWPQVDAFFTQQWARPDPHSSTNIEWGPAWHAGISVSVPLFDGLAREGRIVQERAALRQNEIRLVDAEERALLQIRQAILSVRDAEEFVESQRLNLDRATEGLRLAGVGYREGVNTEVEVTDARAALTRASALHFKAIYDHTMARLDLQRAMGILGPEPGASDLLRAPAAPGRIEPFMEAPRPPRDERVGGDAQ